MLYIFLLTMALTVSKSKQAVLLRLPKKVMEEVKRRAKKEDTTRTMVIYRILAADSVLGKLFNGVLDKRG